MTSIKSIFNLKAQSTLVDRPSSRLITNDMVGVEIELEGLDIHGLSENIDPRVNVIEDGSLRNQGVEFVFNEPMYGTDVIQSIYDVFETIEETGDEPIVSDRCSIHVHLDVRDLEYYQILNLITVYLMCEPYFFQMGGTHRMQNAYTIPLASSRSYLGALGKALGASDDDAQSMFGIHIKNSVKYSALNVAPIRTQGSVEFRHHEGTTDPDRIINWINMVLSMKRYVLSLEGGQRMTPEFLDRIVTGGYERFIADIFNGCHVNTDVDTWSNAARVSKRLATMAAGIDHSCTLSNDDVNGDNLFYTTQREVGRAPLELGAIENIVNHLSGRGTSNEGDPMAYFTTASEQPTLRPQDLTWGTGTHVYTRTARSTPRGISSTESLQRELDRLRERQRAGIPVSDPFRNRGGS